MQTGVEGIPIVEDREEEVGGARLVNFVFDALFAEPFDGAGVLALKRFIFRLLEDAVERRWRFAATLLKLADPGLNRGDPFVCVSDGSDLARNFRNFMFPVFYDFD